MKKNIIIFGLGVVTLSLTAFGFMKNNSFKEVQNCSVVTKIEDPKDVNYFTTFKDKDYTLHFEIDNSESKPSLIISILLHNDSYFVSPHAKRDFKGKFYMDLGNYSNLDFDSEIIETPQSVEEIDSHPYVNGTVNWVRKNTIYKQPLNIKTQEDFTVFGRVQFTIEPRCTLEVMPFGISYENGKMRLIDPKC